MKRTTTHWILALTTAMALLVGVGVPAQGAPQANAPASEALTIVAPGGWTKVDDDTVVSVPGGASSSREATTAGVEDGFLTSPDVRAILDRYVIRLQATPGTEAIRPYLVSAAADLTALTGANITVAAGTTTVTTGYSQEILATVATTSPCGDLDSWLVGCGGWRGWSDGRNDKYLVSWGAVWFTSDWQDLSEADRNGLVRHELGHVLGLDHFDTLYEGNSQVMESSLNGVATYQSGDINGLRDLYSRRPQPWFPLTTWDSFVAQQLRDFTGSAGTTSSRAATVTRLRNGTLDPKTYIASLVDHPSFRPQVAPVVRLYWAYFGRKPDPSGLRYWVGRRRAGSTMARISQSLATSSEFIRKYGSLSNRQFVTRIYSEVLGRSPDSGGVDYWTRKLNSGTTRGQVMVNFSESSEYIRRMQGRVDTVLVYAGMLNHIPDAADLEFARVLTMPEIIRFVQTSPDYAAYPQMWCAKYCGEWIWP